MQGKEASYEKNTGCVVKCVHLTPYSNDLFKFYILKTGPANINTFHLFYEWNTPTPLILKTFKPTFLVIKLHIWSFK